MIKRMGLFQRRQDLTQTQFSSYWAKKHSPLVLGMPRFIRYVQNHRVDLLPNFTSSHLGFDLDGIAEMYWNDEAEMQRDFSSQQGIDILRQDETEFMSKISVCIVNEGCLTGNLANIKLMLCLDARMKHFDEKQFIQALPHLKGVQSSEVLEVMTRPQLCEIKNIPQYFISLWFDQYDHVLKDFQANGWDHYYKNQLSELTRLSLISLHCLTIRNI